MAWGMNHSKEWSMHQLDILKRQKGSLVWQRATPAALWFHAHRHVQTLVDAQHYTSGIQDPLLQRLICCVQRFIIIIIIICVVDTETLYRPTCSTLKITRIDKEISRVDDVSGINRILSVPIITTHTEFELMCKLEQFLLPSYALI